MSAARRDCDLRGRNILEKNFCEVHTCVYNTCINKMKHVLKIMSKADGFKFTHLSSQHKKLLSLIVMMMSYSSIINFMQNIDFFSFEISVKKYRETMRNYQLFWCILYLRIFKSTTWKFLSKFRHKIIFKIKSVYYFVAHILEIYLVFIDFCSR